MIALGDGYKVTESVQSRVGCEIGTNYSPIYIANFDEYFLMVYFLYTTVLPAKSDSDVMFVYKVFRDLESKNHLCINPIHRLGLMHK